MTWVTENFPLILVAGIVLLFGLFGWTMGLTPERNKRCFSCGRELEDCDCSQERANAK